MTKFIAPVAIVLMLAGAAQADVLFHEPFDGGGGTALNGFNGWFDKDGDMTVETGTLSFPGVASSGGRAVRGPGGIGFWEIYKDGLTAVSDQFSASTGGTVYITWLARNDGGKLGGIFTGIRDASFPGDQTPGPDASGHGVFAGQESSGDGNDWNLPRTNVGGGPDSDTVFVNDWTNSGVYLVAIAIDHDGTSGGTVDDIYAAVYGANSPMGTTAVDPSTLASPNVLSIDINTQNKYAGNPAPDISKFYINLAESGGVQIDEIRIATTWGEALGIPEPTTLALLGVGGILALLRRRCEA